MGDLILPTLYFLEFICLPEAATKARLIKDPNYTDFAYCKSDGGVFKVGVSGLADALVKGVSLSDVGSCRVDWIVNALSLSSTYADLLIC
jgi:hypothetical protein